jgi:GR25 family glycosyltransferase involved in LPS biosynthesis
MKAFVINLKSRPDRWAKIQKRFAGSDIELLRLEAVKSETNGLHGCFLSHIKALKRAKKEGLPYILILEDDCLPAVGWKSNWQKIKKWLDSHPKKWDIYSGGAHGIVFPNEIGRKDGIKYYDPLWSVGTQWLYIAERSYDMILSHYDKYNFTAKLWVPFGNDAHNNLFKTVITCPFLAYQDSDNSDIGKKYRNQRKTYKNAERKLCSTRKHKRNAHSQ